MRELGTQSRTTTRTRGAYPSSSFACGVVAQFLIKIRLVEFFVVTQIMPQRLLVPRTRPNNRSSCFPTRLQRGRLADHSASNSLLRSIMFNFMCWWARQDSNPHPVDYESTAPPLSYWPIKQSDPVELREGSSCWHYRVPFGPARQFHPANRVRFSHTHSSFDAQSDRHDSKDLSDPLVYRI